MVWSFLVVSCALKHYPPTLVKAQLARSFHHDRWFSHGGSVVQYPLGPSTLVDIFPEVCSAHPTSGGPYFWAAMLSTPKKAPFASWICGWFNLLGQVAVTTGIRFFPFPAYLRSYITLTGYSHSFGCATFISTAATINTSFVPNEKTTIGVYAAVLVSQGPSWMIDIFRSTSTR